MTFIFALYSIDSNHPLFVSDPLRKAQQTENDNNCLHWIAMGICGYKESGKCRLDHPSQFAAKNFLCPILSKRGECTKRNCAYCHDPEQLPSKYFNTEELAAWEQAKIIKRAAFQKWIDKKNSSKDNESSWKEEHIDEGQTTFVSNEPFTSLLTE